jgi:hypothetical protein
VNRAKECEQKKGAGMLLQARLDSESSASWMMNPGSVAIFDKRISRDEVKVWLDFVLSWLHTKGTKQ